jgi:hypothetical protein
MVYLKEEAVADMYLEKFPKEGGKEDTGRELSY